MGIINTLVTTNDIKIIKNFDSSARKAIFLLYPKNKEAL